MAESFPMIGGDGTYSYTKNSQYQKQGSDLAKEMIKDAIIKNLDTTTISTTAFRIVDFGCSVGPNTFSAVQNLIEAVEQKCSSLQGLEFQVFFNDHIANDFNTLFASLPPERRYYTAGTPGSFHGRLFPRGSIKLAYSSYALQWLTKVPEGLLNEGRIHYTRASKEVVEAYADEFEKDMGVFISARAQEIVGGGLLIIVMPGVPDGVNHDQIPANLLYTFLGSSLMDLANQGIIDKAKVDAFNLPIYAPSPCEMRNVIEKNGCFSIEGIEMTIPSSQDSVTSSHVHSLIMHLRAALEGIFTKHLENDVVDKMFNKTLAKSEEISASLGSIYPISTHLFLVLKRKY